MNAALATLSGVTKRFGTVTALDGIDAALMGGGITGLVGPDGAGKTTLIRLIVGLMRPDAGSIAVLGRDIGAGGGDVHAEIGYMPQRFGLYEDLSVAENLRLHADLKGLAPAARPERFAQLLDLTALAPFQARLAGRLSGGMKQKLGLACALLRRPRLLVLDEPAVGVDPISRRDLWSLVADLAAGGTGVLWSTAYLDEAEACDRVLLLDRGRLLHDGPPAELTGRLQGRVFRLVEHGGRRRTRLAQLMADRRLIDGTVQGRALRLVTAADTPAPDDLGPIEPTAPRFEDAFVDLLGGAPGGRSALAEAMPALAPDDKPVIEARGLTRRFGDFTAADDITFAIPRGEIFGLLGPNGAGKSTTFKMLCGLLKPSSGDGRVAGFDLRRDGAAARNRLGYMAQKFSLYGDLSVAQNLAFFAGVYGLKGGERRQRVDEMTQIFDFGPRLDTSAKDLPLGFKQRLALACAVMHRPEALFLDEPTSGVDPLTRREFWTHINGLVEKGVTILVTTHFMDEAEYCDRIALIYRGRAIALGPPDQLKAQAATPDRPEPTLEDAFIALVEAA